MIDLSADLVLGIHRHDQESYTVEFRFSLPDSDAEVRLGQGQPILTQFDLAKIRTLLNDPNEVGLELGRALFAEPAIKSAFDQARAATHAQDFPLRLRLLIEYHAPELHNLPWETMQTRKTSRFCSAVINCIFLDT